MVFQLSSHGQMGGKSIPRHGNSSVHGPTLGRSRRINKQKGEARRIRAERQRAVWLEEAGGPREA